MSKGILQLAVTGKVPLHLEYRSLGLQPDALGASTESAEAKAMGSYVPSVTGTFELIYGEY